MKKILIFLTIIFLPSFVFAAIPVLTITPEKTIQGEPIIIKIENINDLTKISKITFGKENIKPFISVLFFS